ncbi:hypothetical protein C9374_009848 [Naegleria lovaniensis]|uniref:Rab family small GTPase n=1 Tax=Naegleria lovaniensis TaxID=51637 RepID=A0AA88GCW3_NAELO|nr:uncharacterized protein C9374_009848 [Naegleria lovaniensis]KAG2375225.1 hypothetical protein C9374_009848 [Naegleria lovaniensis]
MSSHNASDEYGAESGIPTFKVIVIGDVSVGKTSIISRFCDGEFKESYPSSLGVDFKMKEMKVSNQSAIKLQVWDFAADIHNRFANVAKHSYSEAHAIIIVFDITNKESFQDLETHWLGELQQQTLRENHFKILVGNKSDLVDKRVVTNAQSLASKYGCEYMETSAKKGDNIDQLFQTVGRNIFEAYQRGGFKEELWTEDKEKKKKCSLQ